MNAIQKEFAEIRAKLDLIEGHLAWLIVADTRFKVGQRVEFSQRAKRRHLFPSTRLGLRGTIKRIGSFDLDVLIDGYKQPRSFHHAFFNPVSGPKLF